jgi:RHS repeat-associated protein
MELIRRLLEMRKGFRGAIFFLLFSLVLWGGVVPIFAAGSSLKVRMYNGNTAAVINTIFPWYRLTNTGSTAIDLSKVKIRYYYTIDGEKPQNFWCDWSTIGAANVTGTFGKLNPAFAGADSYFELGFKPGAGFLKPGRSIEAQNRIAKTDWTNYNQRNDYSFNASAKTYVDWNKIRVTIESDVPVTSHDYTHNGEWVNQPVTIHLTVAGGGAGVTTYYKIDNGPNQSGKTIAITENGTHTVSFWSVNGSGNSETPQSLIVKLDQSKPALVAALDPSANTAGWNNSDTTITYTATDNVSGIKSVTAPVTVSSEGANQTYQGTAVDIAGNTTNVSVTVNLDKTLPVISDLQPAASTTVTTKKPLISAVLSDSLSGIDSATLGLTLDGKTVVGTYDATTGKVTYIPSTDLSVGSHTFSVTGTDLAGNKATVAGSTFTVKGVVPVTSHNYLYDGKWVNQPVTINLTAKGESTEITTYYKIDNGTTQTGQTISVSEDGIHAVTFWSVDSYGNTETAKSLSVKLDQTLPTVSSLYPADAALLTDTKPTLSAVLSDNLSGINADSITLTLDGATITGTYDATTGKVIHTPSAGLSFGSHTFTVAVADPAGNQAAVGSAFTIQDTAPVTSHDYTHDGEWVNQPVTINLTVTGGTGVTTYYQIDDGSVRTGNTIFITTEGIHTVSFWSVTASGTSETAQTLTVKLDQTLPAITGLYPADAASITATKPTFAAGLADNLSGINPATVSLTVDGATVAGSYDTATGKVTYTPNTALTVGSHTFMVAVADLAGNQATVGSTFYIKNSDPNVPPDPATVAPPLDTSIVTGMQDATSFLYTGENPIQSGVDAKTIVAKRAAVIRGKVLDANGDPLPGVKLTILNHSEYGHTYSRADGMFDMAVNGGGYLTVKYAKDGYLGVQRQVNVPWQDYVWADEARLITYDTNVTMITQNSAEGQLARGSVSSDNRGERQATLFFPAGTTISGASGDAVSIRATEFTVGTDGPKKMPAALPVTSAYTYCVDLSVDGAENVQFNKPVYFYVDNFLNFPVGGNVPTGYYDDDKGVWIPSDNGVVIKILSVTDGLADVDVAGSGAAADADTLSGLGFTDAEQKQLAETYAVGKTLWRVPISHFSLWDCNWGWGLPEGAVSYSQGSKRKPQVQRDIEKPDSCYIERQNQTTREAAEIPGTPFTIDYSSERASGRITNYSIEIPLSGTTVPDSLKRIELKVEVAGQKYTKSFDTTANQTTTYIWDGKDSYGRTVAGLKTATVTIGYVYNGSYQTTTKFSSASTGATISGDRASFEMTLSQTYTVTLGSCPDDAKEINGWSLNAHHFYDSTGRILYLGDGNKRSAENISTIITTVAGTGETGYSGDGGPALNARISYIADTAFAPDGSLYIADCRNFCIRKISPDGVITTVAGTGELGYSGDGGPATEAKLLYPDCIAIGPDGSLYIATSYIPNYVGSTIRKVSPDGTITWVGGSGAYAHGGDGQSVTLASFRRITSMIVAKDGSIYVTDTYDYRVRRIDPGGIASTVAGNGTVGYNIDLIGPAKDVELYWPYRVAQGPDGNIYFGDGNFIRCIKPDGSISTYSGTRDSGRNDGVSAKQSWICPQDFEFAKDGSMYILDVVNEDGGTVIRRVGSNGIITTVAGKTVPLTSLNALSFNQDGILYFADNSQFQICMNALALTEISEKEIGIISEDGTEIYQFDTNGRHLKTQDAATGKVLYTFGYDGKLTSITDRDGNVTTITRSGDQTVITAPFGQKTTLIANSDGYLQSITNPANETRSYTYADGGLLETTTDPKGQSYQFTYDSLGRAIKQSNPDGGSITLERSDLDLGYQVTATATQDDSNNSVTTYSVENLPTGEAQRKTVRDGVTLETRIINTDGGTETTTLADGTVTTITKGPDPHFGVSGMQAPIITGMTVKTPAGLTYSMTGSRTVTLTDSNDPFSLQTQTDTVTANGKTSTSVYDVAAKTVTATSPEGRKTVTTLDDLGRVVKTEVNGLAPVAFTYDSYGRLATVTSSSGTETRTSTISYDSQGYVASTTDPLSKSTRFTYDAVGRVTAQTLPDGQQINFSYDANGNVTTLTPPGKPDHKFSYTTMDLDDTYTPPDVGAGSNITQYTYNLNQQPVLVTRPDGRTVGFAYDTQGRLLNITLPGGEIITYGYDGTTGNLTDLTVPDGGTLAFDYDGSLPTKTTWAGTVAGSVEAAYDNDFKVTAQTVNGSNSVSYTYDNDGLLTGAGSLNITRNVDNGLLTGTSLGNVTDSVIYNAFGETTKYQAQVVGSTAFDSQYTYDSLGRIESKAEVVGSDSHIYRYSYDSVGQLTDVYKDGGLYSHYDYDANGNRTAYTGSDSSIAVTIYDDQDRLAKYGSNTYQYTANGELQTKTNSEGTTKYEYDVLGNLDAVTLADGTKIAYLTDGSNRRIGRKVNGVLKQGFLYQDGLNPIAELDSSNNVVARFVYGTRANVPDYMVKDGVTYRIISDHLGSVRLVVNSSTGDIVQKMEYDEFGRVLSDSNPGFQPFGYAGGIYDPQTGLVRFGARDYDSETGRWTGKDPIGFKGGTSNLYEYVFNDPINLFDFFGLYWEYSQSTGDLTYVDNNTAGRTYVATGYSGHGDGVNNPDMQDVQNVGPIPEGTWTIGGQYNHSRLGNHVMNLTPATGTDTYGRSLFRIHGDNARGDQSASEGCIILSRDIRDRIADSGDNELRVVR